ncbi:MAG: hypothetical protein ACR2LT_00715 [Pyrinomonadaceae bacterium]
MNNKISNLLLDVSRQNLIFTFGGKTADSSEMRLQNNTTQQKFPVPPSVEIKTIKNEDPRQLHRRYLMEAASEAGLDGTDQQKKFVENWLKSGMVFTDKSEDTSPDDNDLRVKSDDIENAWKTYGLSDKEINDLKRLQKEYKAQGGILKRGKTYENIPAGEAFAMARRGRTVSRPLSDARYEAQKMRELWERARIPETSIFGTPSKLRDLKHISLDVPPDATAEQTDRILSAYIEKNYSDRDNLWSDNKANILKIAKNNGVKIENLSVKNGKADFDMSVESLLKLHIAYIGVQEKANIIEAQVKEQQNNSAFNQFLIGVGEGAWNNLKDTGQALSHPINTLHGIYEGAKAAGSIAVELAKMPESERTALYVQLAAAGVKGLGEMTVAQASRQIGKFVGSLAVDVALGKPIGTAISLLKDLKLGSKIIKESVELSKTIKQTLGNVKVPLSDMKVVSDTMGNKWWIRDGELKKLEDIIKPMESRAKETLSGVKKAINLPKWEKLTFKLDPDGSIHFLSGHKKDGNRLTNSIRDGGRKTVFPEWMNDDQIIKAVKEAYNSSKKVETQLVDGEKRIRLIGQSNDLKIEMWVNLTTETLESAYVKGGR